MIFLPLLLLPVFAWLVDGAPWYAVLNAVFVYVYGYTMWGRWLRRRALSGL
jgi:hypothetical protein